MQVQEGEGWRLLVDPARCPFVVLIGGEGWAAELTVEEARTLQQGVNRLVAEHAFLKGQLMDEEAITLELDIDGLWLSLEGDCVSWELRFVLTPAASQRGIEGRWQRGATQAFAAALAQWALPHETGLGMQGDQQC